MIGQHRIDKWTRILADNHRLHFKSKDSLADLLKYINDCFEDPVLHGDCD